MANRRLGTSLVHCCTEHKKRRQNKRAEGCRFTAKMPMVSFDSVQLMLIEDAHCGGRWWANVKIRRAGRQNWRVLPFLQVRYTHRSTGALTRWETAESKVLKPLKFVYLKKHSTTFLCEASNLCAKAVQLYRMAAIDFLNGAMLSSTASTSISAITLSCFDSFQLLFMASFYLSLPISVS